MSIVLNVPDISCAHCKSTIEGALGNLAGIVKVEVDIADRTVELDTNPEVVSLDQIITALEEVGYEVAT